MNKTTFSRQHQLNKNKISHTQQKLIRNIKNAQQYQHPPQGDAGSRESSSVDENPAEFENLMNIMISREEFIKSIEIIMHKSLGILRSSRR